MFDDDPVDFESTGSTRAISRAFDPAIHALSRRLKLRKIVSPTWRK